jgi:hypothetical protein
MRKRSEAPVQQSFTPAEKTVPLPLGEVPKGADSLKLPIEGDLSAMCVALKGRGYGKVRLTTVTDWLPQVRHVVAMWLDGQLQESDLPESIKGLKGEHVEGGSPAHAKPTVEKDVSPEELARYKAAGEELAFSVEDDKGKDARRKESEKLKKYTDPEFQKPAEEKPRASVDIQTPGKSLPPVVDRYPEILGELISTPDTVTVTWGSEKFYPTSKSYNNFEVGMLSTTVHLKSGQDKSAAARAAYDELEKLGEEFRERKRVSFLRGLKGILGDAKEEK